MSENYAGNSNSYPTNIVLPQDGDPASEAFFQPPWRQLADRTAFLRAASDLYSVYFGIVATTAALKAIDTTTLATGAIRTVAGVGLFYFDSAASDTEVIPWIVDPTTGPGRWKLLAEMQRLTSDVITATGTWTCPLGVTSVILIGYGSGGSGGGGAPGATTTARYRQGGGGGGGARQGCDYVTGLTPGTVYDITVGAAVTGGTAGNDGSNGNPTIFGATSGVLKRTFVGGGKGYGGKAGVADTDPGNEFMYGGADVPALTANRDLMVNTDIGDQAVLVTRFDQDASSRRAPYRSFPQHGGFSGIRGNMASAAPGWDGQNAPNGNLGGTAGNAGTDGSGGYHYGQPGGGGGAGYGIGIVASIGGTGGNGGNGGTGATGTAGTNGGSPALANSGAGGGGGGGGGSGSTTAGAGGTGGTSSAGKLIIIYNTTAIVAP